MLLLTMSLFSTLDDTRFAVRGRFMLGVLIRLPGMSGLNCCEKYHDELIRPTAPEKLWNDIRQYFTVGRSPPTVRQHPL